MFACSLIFIKKNCQKKSHFCQTYQKKSYFSQKKAIKKVTFVKTWSKKSLLSKGWSKNGQQKRVTFVKKSFLLKESHFYEVIFVKQSSKGKFYQQEWSFLHDDFSKIVHVGMSTIFYLNKKIITIPLPHICMGSGRQRESHTFFVTKILNFARKKFGTFFMKKNGFFNGNFFKFFS